MESERDGIIGGGIYDVRLFWEMNWHLSIPTPAPPLPKLDTLWLSTYVKCLGDWRPSKNQVYFP